MDLALFKNNQQLPHSGEASTHENSSFKDTCRMSSRMPSPPEEMTMQLQCPTGNPEIGHDTSMHGIEQQDCGVMDLSQQLAHMDELNKQLAEIKESLIQTSIRSHLLNIDVLTLFNPETMKIIEKATMDCQQCVDRIQAQMKEDCFTQS